MSNETDAIEIRRFREAFAAAADVVPAAEPCPEPERLWEAAAGELDPRATREVVEHLAECPQCAESWRLALELDPHRSDVRADDAPAIAGRADGRGRMRTWLAAAAAVASIALGLAWVAPELLERGPAGGEPIYRDARPAAGAIRSALPADRPLPRRSPILVWSPLDAEGTTYDVLVSTEELEPVADARDLAEARYQLPAGALDALPANTRLLWRVTAETPDGEVVRSPTFSVVLGPAAD